MRHPHKSRERYSATGYAIARRATTTTTTTTIIVIIIIIYNERPRGCETEAA
jgi:hypothetical protein